MKVEEGGVLRISRLLVLSTKNISYVCLSLDSFKTVRNRDDCQRPFENHIIVSAITNISRRRDYLYKYVIFSGLKIKSYPYQ